MIRSIQHNIAVVGIRRCVYGGIDWFCPGFEDVLMIFFISHCCDGDCVRMLLFILDRCGL